MTSLENDPTGRGKMLTGQNYLEDLKLHIDIISKIDPRGDNPEIRFSIPRRKKVFRIAEKMISQLNALELAADLDPDGEASGKLIKMYYNYGVDSVEDLAMIMAEQYIAQEAKKSFKNLVGDNDQAILKFSTIKDQHGVDDTVMDLDTVEEYIKKRGTLTKKSLTRPRV
jgi:hypothetical protein